MLLTLRHSLRVGITTKVNRRATNSRHTTGMNGPTTKANGSIPKGADSRPSPAIRGTRRRRDLVRVKLVERNSRMISGLVRCEFASNRLHFRLGSAVHRHSRHTHSNSHLDHGHRAVPPETNGQRHATRTHRNNGHQRITMFAFKFTTHRLIARLNNGQRTNLYFHINTQRITIKGTRIVLNAFRVAYHNLNSNGTTILATHTASNSEGLQLTLHSVTKRSHVRRLHPNLPRLLNLKVIRGGIKSFLVRTNRNTRLKVMRQVKRRTSISRGIHLSKRAILGTGQRRIGIRRLLIKRLKGYRARLITRHENTRATHISGRVNSITGTLRLRTLTLGHVNHDLSQLNGKVTTTIFTVAASRCLIENLRGRSIATRLTLLRYNGNVRRLVRRTLTTRITNSNGVPTRTHVSTSRFNGLNSRAQERIISTGMTRILRRVRNLHSTQSERSNSSSSVKSTLQTLHHVRNVSLLRIHLLGRTQSPTDKSHTVGYLC